MPRRSKRSQQNTLDSSSSRKPDKAEDGDDGDTANFIGDDSEEGSLEEEEPPRKRAKRSHKSKYVGTESSAKNRKGKIPEQFRKVRGRTGLLEKLAKDVPLDVILEASTSY
ncbi:hypothetical protein D9757_010855 [Collybiopsis confluens]|uniref:Uncharacterized protein n=1 Tax=Collybiopsis confluens TaxID=2823264 RepID=A0A8H5H7Z2_9AGAR|nr:hypothetical protein D9757_010855 [Collybiopsis confluens]